MSTDSEEDRRVVRLVGEHDVATVLAISEALMEAIEADGGDLVVDLSGVTFMDLSTIGVLTAARNNLSQRGRRVSLRSPSKCARRLLELCDLDELIESSPSERTAAASPGALSSWVSVPTTEAERTSGSPSESRPAPASVGSASDTPAGVRANAESAPPRTGR